MCLKHFSDLCWERILTCTCHDSATACSHHLTLSGSPAFHANPLDDRGTCALVQIGAESYYPANCPHSSFTKGYATWLWNHRQSMVQNLKSQQCNEKVGLNVVLKTNSGNMQNETHAQTQNPRTLKLNLASTPWNILHLFLCFVCFLCILSLLVASKHI